MSLNWQWDDKMGTCTYTDGHTSNIYRGNAFMIAVNEWTENERDLYNLAWFACDEQHMKNMLGLSKDYPGNDFADFGIVKFELNTNYKETAKFITLLAKAKAEVEIKLYTTPW